jgi:hypothetical protein
MLDNIKIKEERLEELFTGGLSAWNGSLGRALHVLFLRIKQKEMSQVDTN